MTNPNGDPGFQAENQIVEPGVLGRIGGAMLHLATEIIDFGANHGLGQFSHASQSSVESATSDRRHVPGDPSPYDPMPESWSSTRRT